MSETWYQASKTRLIVAPIIIERATKSCVWINGRKRFMTGNFEGFFASEDQAWQWLQKSSEAKIRKLQSQLMSENTRLTEILKAREEASK